MIPSSKPSERIRCPVRVDEQDLIVTGGVDAFGALDFSIERADGRPWMKISEPAHNVHGVDVQREILALSQADELLVRIAMGTGWFIRTGRSVRHPINECNEVWAISPACRQLLATIGLVLEARCAKVGTHVLNPTPPRLEESLHATLTAWMTQLRRANVSSAVVTVSNPYSQSSGARLMVAAYPETLRRSAALFEHGDLPDQPQPLAQWGRLEEQATARWAPFMKSMGYRSFVVLRVPAAPGHFIECLMFSTAALVDEAQAAVPVCIAINALPQLKQAASTAVCNLTPRERSCLLSAFAGRTATETAVELECMPRTVRLHLSNAMLKLGTTSTTAAIQRALMLGIF